MNIRVSSYVAIVLLIGLSAVLFIWDGPILLIEKAVGHNLILGGAVFGIIMFIATVIAPIAVLPAVPLMAPVLGPFNTALISIVSWTLGAVVAFLIARHAGRSIVSRFVSLDTFDRYESYIPQDTRFLTVLLLRMVVPVDVLSYALGLFSSISLFQYTIATVLGVTWFSFAFAYLGASAAQHNLILFAGIAVGSVLILGLGWRYMIQMVQRNKEK